MNQMKNIVEILDGYSFDDISYQVVHAECDNNVWDITIKASYKRVSEKLPSILDVVDRLEGYRGNGYWKVQEIKKNNCTEIQNIGLYSITLKYIGGNNEEKN